MIYYLAKVEMSSYLCSNYLFGKFAIKNIDSTLLFRCLKISLPHSFVEGDILSFNSISLSSSVTNTHTVKCNCVLNVNKKQEIRLNTCSRCSIQLLDKIKVDLPSIPLICKTGHRITARNYGLSCFQSRSNYLFG